MTDISRFYTQQSIGTTPQGLTTGQSVGTGLFADPSATGSFLDQLLGALLTNTIPTTNTGDKGADPATTLLDGKTTAPLATSDTPVVDTSDDTTVVAGLNPVLLTEPVSAPTTSGNNDVGINDIDPAALNAIEPGNEDYTQTLDARLKAQVLALLKKNGIEIPGITTAPAPVVPASPVDAAGVITTDAPVTTTVNTAPITDIPTTTEPTNDVAAQLNAMTVGAGEKDQTKGDKGKPISFLDALTKGANGSDAYQGVITQTQGGYQPNTNPQTPANTGTNTTNTSPTPASNLNDDNDAFFKLDLSAITPENIAGSLAQTSTQVNNNAVRSAANGNSQSPAALHAVAMHLQQMGQNRDTRSMTLHLNPPELGKLQVKMTYGKDKSVKADIMVEKSDTFSMLQKDADSLKQALNNAGLQADAGSLNFSLADQGAFDDNMRSADNGPGNERIIGDVNSDIALIEIKSSEEWSVDPKTGIVRYNIVV